MREIKFRGKRVDTGEWVYGSLVQCDITGKRYILPVGSDANESDKVRHEGCLMLFTFEVIPETIGQHTGLKDKNGKEIYEGDIVHASGHYPGVGWYDTGEHDYDFTAPVKWNKEKATYTCKQYYLHELERVVVIGNIWENPELIKGES